jgi:hypothetical protein
MALLVTDSAIGTGFQIPPDANQTDLRERIEHRGERAEIPAEEHRLEERSDSEKSDDSIADPTKGAVTHA